MATPVWTLTKSASTTDSSSFGIQDFTVYGGTYTARAVLALVLFVTRTDKNGVRTLQGITPNLTNPLTVYAWTINSIDDGLIEKILFAINIWSSATAYVTGDIVYNSANSTFYKCLVGNTNVIPSSNPTDWAVITTDALYANELANASTQIAVVDMFDANTSRIEMRINKEWQRISDNFISGLDKAADYNQASEMDDYLNGAYSALNNGRPYECDEIIQGITNYVLDYGALN